MKMKYNDFENAMNSYFLDTSDNTLNIGYMLEGIYNWIDNTDVYITRIKYNKEIPIIDIVFHGMVDYFTDCCYNIHYPLLGRNKYLHYVPTDKQIKKYLNEYTEDYKKALEPLIADFEEIRNNSNK